MTEKKAKRITIENLRLLKGAWEKNDFDPKMFYYGGIDDVYSSDLIVGEINQCGTDCCALGYAPNVAGLEIQESDFVTGQFNYDDYSERIFPALSNEFDNSEAWTYLFGHLWPNSRVDFLRRINYLIDMDLEITPEMQDELIANGF